MIERNWHRIRRQDKEREEKVTENYREGESSVGLINRDSVRKTQRDKTSRKIKRVNVCVCMLV